MATEFEKIKWPQAVFITGTGTDVGKTYATGWLARKMLDNGLSVITQKFVQTGNTDYSEDIICHRRIMGIDPQSADICHLTAPVIYSYPCSPELAARIDGKTFNPEVPAQATKTLAKQYDHILIEGAGGLMVPLTPDMLTSDYIRNNNLPTIVVFNGQLGSINHTLLTVDAIKNSGISLFGMVYNPYFDQDKTICSDTISFVERYCSNLYPDSFFLIME